MPALRTLAIGLDWFPEHGGGLDRYFLDFIRHAGLADIDARGLVAGRPSVAQESGGQVRSFAARDHSLAVRAIAVRRATRTLLHDWRPQLVTAHFALHALPSLDLIRTPLVVHFQGPWALESSVGTPPSLANRIKHRVETAVYRRADRCIVLSRAFGDLLVERYGVDPARVHVVPPSIEIDRFATSAMTQREAREHLNWPAERPTLFCVRRLVQRMGLRQLIQAVAEVSRDVPDLLCLIAGKGPEEADLNRLIAELRVEDNVRLLGFIDDDDLPQAYCAADLSIVPTQELEGFGLITAESLAAGTPVIVTPVGGLPEAVAALSPALILSGSTAQDIAAGLRSWLDGTLQLPDATACRRYAHTQFSWQRGMQRLRAVYDDAIESAGR